MQWEQSSKRGELNKDGVINDVHRAHDRGRHPEPAPAKLPDQGFARSTNKTSTSVLDGRAKGGEENRETHPFTLRIPDGFIHTKHQTRRFRGTPDRINLHQRRFPNERLHIIPHRLPIDVHAIPYLFQRGVAPGVGFAEAVEDVGRVESGVVAYLTRDDFESFGEGGEDELLFAWDLQCVRADVR